MLFSQFKTFLSSLPVPLIPSNEQQTQSSPVVANLMTPVCRASRVFLPSVEMAVSTLTKLPFSSLFVFLSPILVLLLTPSSAYVVMPDAQTNTIATIATSLALSGPFTLSASIVPIGKYDAICIVDDTTFCISYLTNGYLTECVDRDYTPDGSCIYLSLEVTSSQQFHVTTSSGTYSSGSIDFWQRPAKVFVFRPSPIFSNDVTVTNFPTSHVVTGAVLVTNFPSVQTVSGSVSVNNFPSTQTVAGSVMVSNFPYVQSISGTVSINNFPAVQMVDISTLPLEVSGAVEVSNTISATITGDVSVTPLNERATWVSDYPDRPALEMAARKHNRAMHALNGNMKNALFLLPPPVLRVSPDSDPRCVPASYAFPTKTPAEVSHASSSVPSSSSLPVNDLFPKIAFSNNNALASLSPPPQKIVVSSASASIAIQPAAPSRPVSIMHPTSQVVVDALRSRPMTPDPVLAVADLEQPSVEIPPQPFPTHKVLEYAVPVSNKFTLLDSPHSHLLFESIPTPSLFDWQALSDLADAEEDVIETVSALSYRPERFEKAYSSARYTSDSNKQLARATFYRLYKRAKSKPNGRFTNPYVCGAYAGSLHLDVTEETENTPPQKEVVKAPRQKTNTSSQPKPDYDKLRRDRKAMLERIGRGASSTKDVVRTIIQRNLRPVDALYFVVEAHEVLSIDQCVTDDELMFITDRCGSPHGASEIGDHFETFLGEINTEKGFAQAKQRAIGRTQHALNGNVDNNKPVTFAPLNYDKLYRSALTHYNNSRPDLIVEARVYVPLVTSTPYAPPAAGHLDVPNVTFLGPTHLVRINQDISVEEVALYTSLATSMQNAVTAAPYSQRSANLLPISSLTVASVQALLTAHGQATGSSMLALLLNAVLAYDNKTLPPLTALPIDLILRQSTHVWPPGNFYAGQQGYLAFDLTIAEDNAPPSGYLVTDYINAPNSDVICLPKPFITAFGHSLGLALFLFLTIETCTFPYSSEGQAFFTSSVHCRGLFNHSVRTSILVPRVSDAIANTAAASVAASGVYQDGDGNELPYSFTGDFQNIDWSIYVNSHYASITPERLMKALNILIAVYNITQAEVDAVFMLTAGTCFRVQTCAIATPDTGNHFSVVPFTGRILVDVPLELRVPYFSYTYANLIATNLVKRDTLLPSTPWNAHHYYFPHLTAARYMAAANDWFNWFFPASEESLAADPSVSTFFESHIYAPYPARGYWNVQFPSILAQLGCGLSAIGDWLIADAVPHIENRLPRHIYHFEDGTNTTSPPVILHHLVSDALSLPRPGPIFPQIPMGASPPPTSVVLKDYKTYPVPATDYALLSLPTDMLPPEDGEFRLQNESLAVVLYWSHISRLALDLTGRRIPGWLVPPQFAAGPVGASSSSIADIRSWYVWSPAVPHARVPNISRMEFLTTTLPAARITTSTVFPSTFTTFNVSNPLISMPPPTQTSKEPETAETPSGSGHE